MMMTTSRREDIASRLNLSEITRKVPRAFDKFTTIDFPSRESNFPTSIFPLRVSCERENSARINVAKNKRKEESFNMLQLYLLYITSRLVAIRFSLCMSAEGASSTMCL